MRLFFAGIAASIALLGGSFAHAQTSDPQLMITWRANTLAPAWYQGKILPMSGSGVTVTLAGVMGTSFINLANENISWSVDGKFLQRGRGLRTVTVTVPFGATTNRSVTAQIEGYQGGSRLITKTISIPVVRPAVVIDASYPGSVFRSPSIRVRALPFFFNASSSQSLTYTWNINGSSPEGGTNPEVVEVGVVNPTQGSTIDVSISAKKEGDLFGTATNQRTLTYQ